ncbi:Phytochrome kinase substrate-related family protein [Rhynchospora pubera]|uniref:Phytochrome kinase substrate-related family protein n=1 Tax=Rhynchospora pubera TaxID=906938 RepID=A0AAV8D8S5_9POAL|nr:Phytochrome kinase substrate-related family protein [Rhynchospora pubera]
MERHNRITPTYSTIPSPLPKPLPSASKPSSYLSVQPKPHPFPNTSSPYIHPQPETPHRISRRVEDTELSIFDAKKYFNDCSATEKHDIPTNQRPSSVSSIESYAKKHPNRGILTPASSSEASWNSRSGLLPNSQSSVGVKLTSYSLKERPKPPPSPGRRMFSLRCPCVGKKSLEIQDKFSEPKSPICARSTNMSSITNKLQDNQTEDDSASSIVPLEALTKVRISSSTWPKERDFVCSSTSFPPKGPPLFPTEVARTITNPIVFSLPDVNKATKTTVIEPPRESIEVFGTKVPPSRIILKTDEEQLSDTSSDLFELESFTGNSYVTTSYGRHRDSLDDLLDPRRLVQFPPSFRRNSDEAAQSECCYPPSEASVQWSVTTAEGFDRASVANFSSAASEFDEMRFIQAERDRVSKRRAAAGTGGGIGGGLLSCHGDKAVQVRCNSAQPNRTVR